MKNRSILVIVFFTVFLDLLGFGILIPLLPYVTREFHATEIQAGLLMATYSIMQFLFAPLWGRLSDRVGRKPIILLSLAGSAMGYLIFAFAQSLTHLFVSRIVSGIAAANISTAQAIVADCLPPEKRTHGMGMVGAAIGLGFVLGPALAGILVSDHQYMLPFVVAAALSGIDLVMAWFLLPETVNLRDDQHLEERRFSLNRLIESLEVPHIPRLLGASLLYFTAFSLMESTIAFYGSDLFAMTAKQNGYILFGVGIVLVIVQGKVVGKAAMRYGDHNLILSGAAGVMAGLLLMTVAPAFWFFAASALIMAAASGLVIPSLTSLISQLSTPEVQGGILGMNQSMASLGRILGPLAGTTIYQWAGPRYPFFSSVILVLAVLVILRPLRSAPAFEREPESWLSPPAKALPPEEEWVKEKK
ncbi:MAG TPA: MFS transporter [bacterium]|nr:MFS transporter [bacterium]